MLAVIMFKIRIEINMNYMLLTSILLFVCVNFTQGAFDIAYNFAKDPNSYKNNVKAADNKPRLRKGYTYCPWCFPGPCCSEKGVNPVYTRQGMMITDDQGLSSEDDFGIGNGMSACFVVYVFTVAQSSTIFSIDRWKSDVFLELMIDNGKMKVKSAHLGGAFN